MLPPCTRDPEGLALLAACKENPVDLAPRFILSDWLEDQGEDDIAKCLRLSLRNRDRMFPIPTRAQARWQPLNGCKYGWLALRPDEETLAEKLSELRDCQWFGSISLADIGAGIAPRYLQNQPALSHIVALESSAGWPVPPIDGGGKADFANLSKMNFDSSQLEDEDVASLCCDKRVMRLTDLRLGRSPLRGLSIRYLEDAPWMPGLHSLSFTGTGVRSEQILRFVAGPSVVGLQKLLLEDAGSGNDIMKMISRLRSMPRLRELGLRRMFLNAEGLRELFQCFAHRSPEALDLSGNLFGDKGIALLAKWRGLEGVSRLRLNRIGMGSEGLASLVHSRHVTGLTSLDLGDNRLLDQNQLNDILSSEFGSLNILSLAQCELGEHSIASLAHSPLIAGLLVLDLHSNRMGEPGAARLAEAKLRTLTFLELADNFLGDAGVKHLTTGSYLESLTHLGLAGNGIRLRGIEALASASQWNKLTILNLSGNPLGDESIAKLAESELLMTVERLLLIQTGMTDTGLRSLLESPNLSLLQELNLWGNQITDAGADALANCQQLESLTDLYISTEHLTDRGRKMLRNSPHLRHTLIHW